MAEPFKCEQCGGNLNLYAGEETQTIVCSYCNSVFDFSTSSGKRLAKFREKLQGKATPIIPLGRQGQLSGETLTVIGFLTKRTTIEGMTYSWDEYLLVTPTGDFRWLTHYQGHWTYVRTVTDIPTSASLVSRKMKHRTIVYDHFQSAHATTHFVLGEFYWKVRAGETATVEDFVSPPLMLSSEKTDKEISWSFGKYTPAADIWAAFKLTLTPQTPVGVFANQPNPYQPGLKPRRWLGVAFCVAAIGLFGAINSMARHEPVLSQNFTYSTTDPEKSRVTPNFELKGHASNVLIRSSAGLNNQWAFLGMALINADTDEALDFGQELEYYYGVDSDGAWSEGNPSDEIYLPHIAPGTYYLRVEPETNAPALTYSLSLIRDSPRFAYLVIALVLLVLPIFWWEISSYNFEVRRWAESDHPLVSTEED